METGDDQIDDPGYGGEGLMSLPRAHQRTILHLDADCFYAQVEMVRHPELRDKPLGVKQKNLMVTCNYEARSRGVKKSMRLKEAVEALPELVLIDGSDLTHYRHFSAQISSVAQVLTPNVERLGLDENFVDVTDILDDYLSATGYSDVEGHVFGDKEPASLDLVDPCGCGCRERLMAGSVVAKQLRQQIFNETGITVCAGVAHNKLLAKLVCGYHKPNQQTVLFPWQVYNVMNSLTVARNIPGIGSKTFKILNDIGISSVQELQDVPISLLRTKFDSETSRKMKDMSYGIDETPVKKSGKAQSIGLEDAFTKVSSITEVNVKYHVLLERLLKLVEDDGRVPVSIRVTVRKYDITNRFGHRETRQTQISSSLFPSGVANVDENAKSSMMKTVMGLFHKMVDTNKDYHLTLIGVAFNKFIERATHAGAISSFFRKRTRVESAESDKCTEDDRYKISKLYIPLSTEKKLPFVCDESIGDIKNISIGKFSDEIPLTNKVPVHDSVTEIDSRNCNREIVSTECTELVNIPVPRDSKSYSVSINASDYVVQCEKVDAGSNLSSNEQSKDLYVSEQFEVHDRVASTFKNKSTLYLPNEIDPDVFSSLPSDVQDEILNAYSENNDVTNVTPKNTSISKQVTGKYKSKHTMLVSYFKQKHYKENSNGEGANKSKVIQKVGKNHVSQDFPSCSHHSSDTYHAVRNTKTGSSINNYICLLQTNPLTLSASDLALKGIDLDVFRSLPEEIKQEVLQTHASPVQSQTRAKLSARTSTHVKSPLRLSTHTKQSAATSGSASILKYFKKK